MPTTTCPREENLSLRRAVTEKIPMKASEILDSCTTEMSTMLAAEKTLGDSRKIFEEQDRNLVQALLSSQQCFAVSDPSLPDNPIVYVSQGFLKLTGYELGYVRPMAPFLLAWPFARCFVNANQAILNKRQQHESLSTNNTRSSAGTAGSYKARVRTLVQWK